jgi:ribosome-binding protein aMBF1 (putative translation factor)
MAANLLKLIGDRIRTIRKENGLTQEQLAEMAKVHYRYISDIERGERNISIETLEKVMDALKVLPNELFKFENIESVEQRKDKGILIDALNSLLNGRQIEEIQLIFKIAKEVITTYDKLEKKLN